MSSRLSCGGFEQRAFTVTEACAECGQDKLAHDDMSKEGGRSGGDTAHAAACALFAAHPWVADRCAHCGRGASSHAAASDAAAAAPSTAGASALAAEFSALRAEDEARLRTAQITLDEYSARAANLQRGFDAEQARRLRQATERQGADTAVPPSSPRVVPVEPQPTSGHAAALEALSRARAAASGAELERGLLGGDGGDNDNDRAAVHHALHAASASAAAAASASAASAPAAAPAATLSLTVRCADLLAASWFEEATTLVALYALDASAAEPKYVLVGQTEVARGCAPSFKTPLRAPLAGSSFVLRVYDVAAEIVDENDFAAMAIFDLHELLANAQRQRPGAAAAAAAAAGSGATAGTSEEPSSSLRFVTVALPLVHPSDADLDAQLASQNATLTVGFTVGTATATATDASDAAAPAPTAAAAAAAAAAPVAVRHVFTRLVNFLSPSASARNLELRLRAEKVSGLLAAGTSLLTSVWYRSRPTATFRFLASLQMQPTTKLQPFSVGHFPSAAAAAAAAAAGSRGAALGGPTAAAAAAAAAASAPALVVSDEQYLAELSAGAGAGAGGDDEFATAAEGAEDGFELRFLTFDVSKLLAAQPAAELALQTAAGVQRVMAPHANVLLSSSPGASSPAGSSTRDESEDAEGGSFVGAATVSFKALTLACDAGSEVELSLGSDSQFNAKRAFALRIDVQSRLPAPAERDGAAAGVAAAAVPVPSVSAAVLPSAAAKAAALLADGLYFALYSAGQPARNVLLRVARGAGPDNAQLLMRDAPAVDDDGVVAASTASSGAATERSFPLAALTRITGGAASSAAFGAWLSSSGGLPEGDCLLSLDFGAGSQLALEAASWTARDVFVFGLLSMLPASQQQQHGGRMWHPAPISGQAARIVARPAEPKPSAHAAAAAAALVAASAPKQAKPASDTHGSLARPAPSSNAADNAAAAQLRASALAPSSPLGAAYAQAASNAPASPLGAASAASNGAVDLGEVLSKLERLFEAGRNFVRFTAGSHRPLYVSLFLRRSVQASGRAGFALHWAAADNRHMHASRSMRCEDIAGIALGKQSSVFRKEEAALAPAAHCFSIIGSNGAALHLQSWNERDSDTYAFGIASLVKSYCGRKPRLWQAGAYVESPANRLELENQQELLEQHDAATQAVDPSDIPALAAAQSFKCSVELVVACRALPSKHSNHIVCLFDRDEQTEKLTYLAQSEKATRANNPDFRKVFRLTYDSSVVRKLRFNVYDLPPGSKQMDDADRMGSAMLLLKELVDGSGIQYVYKLTHENPAKQALLQKNGATIVVTCTGKSEMSMEGGAART